MHTSTEDETTYLLRSPANRERLLRALGNVQPDLKESVQISHITMEIPEETLLALKISAGQAEEVLRMAAAVKLFELGRLSSGVAAHLAGIPRVVFLSRLADYGVDTFRLSAEDLQRETRLV